MSRSYDHKAIEAKWQRVWEQQALYAASDRRAGAKNYYLLVEFPYPSGNLHIGHWYAFAVPDILARKRRMEGYNVLFPIGFDSFGLPAENAAIKRGSDPEKWTDGNIAQMTVQLRSMGNSFDWSRLLRTSDPEYYRWTQWLFLQLFARGLAYRKRARVNWCPSCRTVLANEQVREGRCERCESAMEWKELEQWFLRITAYADELLRDLEPLDWPEEIKDAQRNWIGRSEGALIKFPLFRARFQKGGAVSRKEKLGEVEVFTTRADTIFSAAFVALAPEHPLLAGATFRRSISNLWDIERYRAASKNKNEVERTRLDGEKSGVELRGIRAVNPATGKDIPVWAADFVLGEYGSGAVFGDAHDERDFAFAKKYGIPLTVSLRPEDAALWEKVRGGEACFSGEGTLVNSVHFDGLRSEAARPRIIAWLAVKGLARGKTQYRLRDWLISRQRYWGVPIPILYAPDGAPRAVPEEALPWILPADVDPKPTGEAPLARSKELAARAEKLFGKGWRPETDTLDTFVDSSWYFLRYLDPRNGAEFCVKEKQRLWMPVDHYSGGAEHTTMHLLYSRFFHKALCDAGLVVHREPYAKRINRGLVLGPDGRKMSKSRGNVVDPDANVERVGADAVRMYLAFMGPYHEAGSYPWDLGGIAGMRRFLERVWRLLAKAKKPQREAREKTKAQDSEAETLLNKTIKKVGEDIEAMKFNTAISALMILGNFLEKEDALARRDFEMFLKLLAPFAPHLAEELWHELGNAASIHAEPWPRFEPLRLFGDTVELVVQVNGKTRAALGVPRGIAQDAALREAKMLPGVRKWIEGKEIRRVVYVPDRLLNIVAG